MTGTLKLTLKILLSLGIAFIYMGFVNLGYIGVEISFNWKFLLITGFNIISGCVFLVAILLIITAGNK